MQNNNKNKVTYLFPQDRCICCGTLVPEGIMVCPSCEMQQKTNTFNHLKDKSGQKNNK